jgi:hypothetical protein
MPGGDQLVTGHEIGSGQGGHSTSKRGGAGTPGMGLSEASRKQNS